MRTAGLVPRRAGQDDRDRIWSWVLDRWVHLGAAQTMPLYEGYHDHGPFSRSTAINCAADAADCDGRWDVALVMDADVVIDPAAAWNAALLANASGQLTFAFERFAGLNQAGTRKILDGYTGDWEPFVAFQFIGSASSCLAVPRPLWDRIGGFDERFAGWGYEDVAFSLACQAMGAGMGRIAGTVWHLWHQPAEGTGDPDSPIWQANYDRCQAYLDAGIDPVAVEKVLRANGQWDRFA